MIRKFFRSSLQSFHRLEGTAYDNSHIPIKLTDTNPPFFKRRAVDFFLCFFLCHRLGVLHLEQGSHILQGNDIQTVLFKERGGCGFRSSPQSFHRLEGVAYDNSHIPIKLTDTNPPFFKRRAVDFFLCFFLCHRLGVLHLEQGSHILQGNDIQTVLFKERGGCGFRSSPQSFHRLEGVAYDNSHIPIKLTDYQAYNHLEFSIIKEAID